MSKCVDFVYKAQSRSFFWAVEISSNNPKNMKWSLIKIKWGCKFSISTRVFKPKSDNQLLVKFTGHHALIVSFASTAFAYQITGLTIKIKKSKP